MLENKVIVVTGGGRGIGRETAIYCAAKGASVVVADPGVAADGSGEDAAPAQATADGWFLKVKSEVAALCARFPLYPTL